MSSKSANKPVIGMDLGGTKILAGVVDGDGKILGMAKRATRPENGTDKVVERMVKTAQDAVESAGLKIKDVAAICSAAPGPLNAEKGIVYYAPNLNGWENVPLGHMLSERLGLPAFIENDVDLGTLGEHTLGAARGVQDVLGIFVGTGIGGGLVLEGKLRQGFRGATAEVGHMIIMPDGPLCGCGNRGCVEALASRTAIERDIWAGVHAGRDSVIPKLMQHEGRERMTSSVLAQAVEQKDALVLEVLARAEFYLGLHVATLVNFIDPQMVVLGGGVVEALGKDFVEPIRRIAYQNFINKYKAHDVQIVQAKLGDNAALQGAAVYARQRLGEE